MFLNAICVLLLSVMTVNCEKITDKLKVEIYYETLCPFSVSFIGDQLYPSMKGNNRLPYTDLKLIPYGKANITQNLITQHMEIECQHGPEECKLNALHACIIENAELTKALDVINCLMADSSRKFSQCASQNGVDAGLVETCTETRTEAEILEIYGQQTAAIGLKIVPTIRIDGVLNTRSRNKFDKTFCRKYTSKFGVELEGC